MEDLLNIIPAFFQVALFFFATIFLALGALLSGGQKLSKKSTDLRVKARIVAIRSGTSTLEDGKTSGMYFPIYEYIAQDGSTIRAESDWGSSSLTDKKIGTSAYVHIDPQNPQRVKTESNILIAVGVGFLCAAGGLIYGALTLFPVTIFTFLGALAALGIGAYKIKKLIIPKHLRLTREQFQQKITAKFKQEREALPVLGQTEVARTQRQQDQIVRKAAPLILAIALGLIAGGFYAGQDTLSLTLNGLPANGIVTGYKSHTNPDGTYYAPTVTYTDRHGAQKTFTDYVSSAGRPYSEGGMVDVLYLDDTETAMITGKFERWILPGFLWLCGVLCLFSAFSSFNKSSRI